MKKICFLLILLTISIFLFSSCVPSASYTNYYRGNEIDQDILDEITALDTLLIDSIISNDNETLNNILNATLQKEFGDNSSSLNVLTETLSGAKYEYFERYYIDISTTNSSSPVVIFSDNNDYTLSITGKDEIFLSIIQIPHGCIDSLLFIIYDHSNKGWEIETIYLGDYQYYGMDANDMYNKAMNLKNENRIMSAYQYGYSSGLIIRPAPFFQYTNELEIMNNLNALVEELNSLYTFPITLKSSDIELFGVSSEVTQQGIVPVIMYLSKFETNGSDENADAIKREAHEIHDEVTKVFFGLGEDFDLFLYRAYNEYPSDPNKEYSVYSTIVDRTSEGN